MPECKMAPRLEEMTRFLSYTDEDWVAFATSSPKEFHELGPKFRETHAHVLGCPQCRRQAVGLVAFHDQAARA